MNLGIDCIRPMVGTPIAPPTALTSNDMSPARARPGGVRRVAGKRRGDRHGADDRLQSRGGRGTLRTMGSWDPEGRMQRADVLVGFTFTAASPKGGGQYR